MNLNEKSHSVSFDCGNGHDSEIFKVGTELKRIYGPRVITMAGNIGSPKVYPIYCKSLFDYVRIGMSSGSLVDEDRYGFHYPMASFLIDLVATINTTGIGLKHTKIIVDGGITTYSDILKCIALGADYVMIGRQFVKLVEANGDLYRKDTSKKDITYEPFTQDIQQILKASQDTIKGLGLFRLYSGNTTTEIRSLQEGYDDIHDSLRRKSFRYSDSRSEWISVNNTLKNWLDGLYDVFTYGFTMAGAKCWKEYKSNIKPARIR